MTTKQPRKKLTQRKPQPKRTAAELHEAARVARRAGEAPEAVRALLEEARRLERAAS